MRYSLFYRIRAKTASISEAREFVEAHPEAETMAEFQGLLLRLEQDDPTDPADRVFLDV